MFGSRRFLTEVTDSSPVGDSATRANNLSRSEKISKEIVEYERRKKIMRQKEQFITHKINDKLRNQVIDLRPVCFVLCVRICVYV